MEWPDVPKLRDEAYKSKPPRPTVMQSLDVPPVAYPDVLDEGEVLHLAKVLGEVAGRETID